MPELPDVTIYVERLRARVVGQRLDRVRLGSPFVLRSVTPPLSAVESRTVRRISRLGKRIVITVDGERSLVIHLMVAGRLRWREAQAQLPRKRGLAAFDFETGMCCSQRRARRNARRSTSSGARRNSRRMTAAVWNLSTRRSTNYRGAHP